MPRAKTITASSVSRYLNRTLGARSPFTVHEGVCIEVRFDPKKNVGEVDLRRPMSALEHGGYSARLAGTKDRVLVSGRTVPRSKTGAR